MKPRVGSRPASAATWLAVTLIASIASAQEYGVPLTDDPPPPPVAPPAPPPPPAAPPAPPAPPPEPAAPPEAPIVLAAATAPALAPEPAAPPPEPPPPPPVEVAPPVTEAPPAGPLPAESINANAPGAAAAEVVSEPTLAPDLTEPMTASPEDTPVGPRERESDAESSPKFIKGELIYVGTRELLSRFNHVGVAIGPQVEQGNYYLNVMPGFAYYGDLFSLAVRAPLRLLALQAGTLEYQGLKVKREDWDEAPDFAKVVRFFTIGRKEDNFYLSVNTLRPTSLGYGMLIDKYQPNLDIDRSMTSLLFDAYNDYGGFQFQANDVTFTNRVIGGLVFVKPLFFLDSPIARSLSIGAEYAGDFRAPRCVRISPDGGPCVQGSGQSAGNDPFTGVNADDTFVRTDRDTGRFGVEEGKVHAAGASLELKLYRDERTSDIKLYGTMHQFLNEGGGQGISAGLLGRFNVGDTWINAFRVRGEFRTFEDGFLPSYFDTLYEVAKYQHLRDPRGAQATATKMQAVFGDPENGFARESLGRRNGYNLEASWGLFKHKRRNKKIAMGFGVSDSNGPDDAQLYAHVEIPALGVLQIFGSYIRGGGASVQSLVEGELLTANNAVLLSGLRLQILPILFINANYSRSYALTRSPGSEYHLGNASIVDTNGEPSPFFVQDRLHENVSTFFVTLEIGIEFDDDEEPVAASGDDDV